MKQFPRILFLAMVVFGPQPRWVKLPTLPHSSQLTKIAQPLRRADMPAALMLRT
jgi:hypothetical protein